MSSRRRLRVTAAGVVLFLLVSFVVSVAAHATPVTINVNGKNGVVRQTEPGITCANGGEGSYRHVLIDSSIPGGVVSQLAGTLRSTLDLHYQSSGPGARAYLLGTESHATVTNQRGTIMFPLTSGTCASPSLAFDGTTFSGSGITQNLVGSGSYRQIGGSGTFTFSSETNPGADNVWNLSINGTLNVLQPALTVKVARTYWAHLGLDYVNRVVSVDYQVANSGPGDAFNVQFLSANTTTPGVRPCGDPYYVTNPCSAGPPGPYPLGDLESCTLNPDGSIPKTCDSEIVTIRYRMDLITGPCTLIILGCTFPTTPTVQMSDALDVATTKTASTTVVAPILPPPL